MRSAPLGRMPPRVVTSFTPAVLMFTFASDPTVADTVAGWLDAFAGLSAASVVQGARVSAVTITAVRVHHACMFVLRGCQRVTAMLASVIIERTRWRTVNVQSFRRSERSVAPRG